MTRIWTADLQHDKLVFWPWATESGEAELQKSFVVFFGRFVASFWESDLMPVWDKDGRASKAIYEGERGGGSTCDLKKSDLMQVSDTDGSQSKQN